MHESYGSIVAEVAEVSIDQGRIRVHEVTCAVDCGTAVNPLGIEAQLQSGIVFGLTAALYGKLPLVDGRPVLDPSMASVLSPATWQVLACCRQTVARARRPASARGPSRAPQTPPSPRFASLARVARALQ
ncbi:molybdopterin cofactor-binding domain-containing protein [Sorangium sp. So ce385]|uniref:molybdopterin cofactor-binding domain-containing protein n=1 Tax=Sorangium sp. So ce385 TaxID=3133308 RepID=UPI003F5C6175